MWGCANTSITSAYLHVAVEDGEVGRLFAIGTVPAPAKRTG